MILLIDLLKELTFGINQFYIFIIICHVPENGFCDAGWTEL